MAFLQTQFFSEALTVEVTVNVILPEGNQGIGMKAIRENVEKAVGLDILSNS